MKKTPRYIFLGGGNGKAFAIVDWEDFDSLSEYRWSLSRYGYAYTRPGGGHCGMHQAIMPGHKMLDHINGNRLDNRRCNLRPCTPTQNAANRRLKSTNKSGFKGVHFGKDRAHLPNPWVAQFGKQGTTRHLGFFSSAEEAARAYDAAAYKEHGEFAYLNFPDSKSSL